MLEAKEKILGRVKESTNRFNRWLNTPLRFTPRMLINLGAAALWIWAVVDYKGAQEEIASQFEVSDTVTTTLDFMHLYDLKPVDHIFGHDFPSTGDVARRFAQDLMAPYLNPNTLSPLIIIEEKKPSFITRRVGQALGFEPKNHCFPTVVKYGDDYATMFLPPGFHKQSLAERAVTFWHEGKHLFFEAPYREIETREAENQAHLGDSILTGLYINKGFVIAGGSIPTLRDYEEALANNDPGIWEEGFRSLISIPIDSC